MTPTLLEIQNIKKLALIRNYLERKFGYMLVSRPINENGVVGFLFSQHYPGKELEQPYLDIFTDNFGDLWAALTFGSTRHAKLEFQGIEDFPRVLDPKIAEILPGVVKTGDFLQVPNPKVDLH